MPFFDETPNLLRTREDILKEAKRRSLFDQAKKYTNSLMDYSPQPDLRDYGNNNINLGDIAKFALEASPGAGDAMAIDDAMKYANENRPIMSGISALSAVPLLGMGMDVVKPAAKKLGGLVDSMPAKKSIGSKRVSDDFYNEIKSKYSDLIDEDDLMGYGIRIIPEGHEVKHGEKLPPSFLWDGDTRTDELAEGVSAAHVTDGWSSPNLDFAIKSLKDNNYHGSQIALVRGDPVSLNDFNDPGEIVLRDAVVIDVEDLIK